MKYLRKFNESKDYNKDEILDIFQELKDDGFNIWIDDGILFAPSYGGLSVKIKGTSEKFGRFDVMDTLEYIERCYDYMMLSYDYNVEVEFTMENVKWPQMMGATREYKIKYENFIGLVNNHETGNFVIMSINFNKNS